MRDYLAPSFCKLSLNTLFEMSSTPPAEQSLLSSRHIQPTRVPLKDASTSLWGSKGEAYQAWDPKPYQANWNIWKPKPRRTVFLFPNDLIKMVRKTVCKNKEGNRVKPCVTALMPAWRGPILRDQRGRYGCAAWPECGEAARYWRNSSWAVGAPSRQPLTKAGLSKALLALSRRSW